MHPTRAVAVTSLAVLLAISPVAGALAERCDSAQGDEGTGDLVVTITEVDSGAFPQVTAHVRAADADGWPLDNLAVADLAAFEDGVQIPAASMSVERDDSQEIGLVLALDVSVPPEVWAQIQEAARSFVGTLGPRDSAAIVSFYDQVQVAQEFTTSKWELEAAIDGLEAGGDYTALNEAAFQAATMAGTLPPGRRAVVIVTDSPNNTGTRSTADAVNQALAAGVPLYVIGLEPKVQPGVLTDMAKLTGGQPFVLSCPNEVSGTLQAITGLLRPGYRVTFQSSLKADNGSHDLTIDVTHAGGQGQATGRFVAVPGEVTVALVDLADGQTVRGTVQLATRVTAPAPIAGVEYLLDGQPLAGQVTWPYALDWDSTTVEAGVHTLTARATDGAGNQGEGQARLNVAPPVVVTLSAPQQEITLGDEVTVEAQVDALAEVAGVEFLLDGEPLGDANTPPYRLSFDSGTCQAGEHLVTAQARDNLGHGGKADLSVRFVAPPAPEPERGWLRAATLALVVAAIAAAVVVAWLVLAAIVGRLRHRYQQRCRLEIENLGNVQSRYQLLAEDPGGALRFQFTLEGASLHHREVAQASGRMEEPARLGATTRAAEVTPPTRPDSAARGRGGLEKAQQATGAGLGVASGIADAIGGVAALLPRSVGTPLRNLAGRLRQQRAAVSRAERVPRQAVSRAKKLPGRISGGGRRSRVKPARPSAAPSRAAAARERTSPTRARDEQRAAPGAPALARSSRSGHRPPP